MKISFLWDRTPKKSLKKQLSKAEINTVTLDNRNLMNTYLKKSLMQFWCV